MSSVQLEQDPEPAAAASAAAAAADVDSRLDSLLVGYMQAVSDYLALAASLESRLASGRIGLSKTRYAMPLSAGLGTAALGRLQYCEADMPEGSATSLVSCNGGGEYAEFELEHRPDAGDRAIRWFGALPPLSLRAARREFESALPLVVAMGNAKSRMAWLDAEMAAIKANNARA